jgi:hypothetical protein
MEMLFTHIAKSFGCIQVGDDAHAYAVGAVSVLKVAAISNGFARVCMPAKSEGISEQSVRESLNAAIDVDFCLRNMDCNTFLRGEPLGRV